MSWVRRRFWLSFALVGCTLAASPQDEGDRPFDARSSPYFGDATIPLREFLNDRHISTAKTQHFCIVGYQNTTDGRAWIHWVEGHQIILWWGANNPLGAKSAIARSRRVLDLKKDVVPSDADLKGSTYLVTRDWVAQVLADCQARGDKYEISTKKR